MERLALRGGERKLRGHAADVSSGNLDLLLWREEGLGGVRPLDHPLEQREGALVREKGVVEFGQVERRLDRIRGEEGRAPVDQVPFDLRRRFAPGDGGYVARAGRGKLLPCLDRTALQGGEETVGVLDRSDGRPLAVQRLQDGSGNPGRLAGWKEAAFGGENCRNAEKGEGGALRSGSVDDAGGVDPRAENACDSSVVVPARSALPRSLQGAFKKSLRRLGVLRNARHRLLAGEEQKEVLLSKRCYVRVHSAGVGDGVPVVQEPVRDGRSHARSSFRGRDFVLL